MKIFKTQLRFYTLLAAGVLSACSVNPATGEKQFAALMSPSQEVGVGAGEHEKIVAQYGLLNDPALNAYINKVGQRVVRDTERPDVMYKFFVIDSPIVNAFALPGGYIYVSRGLLALANNEAELAAVLAHETGHITARHSAERYSTGVVTSLGASVLSAAIGSTAASKAIDLGSGLYLSSYSRGQEAQADELGLRYMSRAGYDTQAMPAFLYSMQQESALQSRMDGKGNAPGMNYFSTHPATSERVGQTSAQRLQYPAGGDLGREEYMKAVNGLIYGESAKQGFVRNGAFYHPEIGFTFAVPDGFDVSNQPSRLVMSSASGAAVIFDLVPTRGATDPLAYLMGWAQGAEMSSPERISVNGMEGATAVFTGEINGRPMNIRLMAVRRGDQFARFQMAIPQNASPSEVEGLKRLTYSFRDMSAEERRDIHALRIVTFVAGANDTIAARASRMPFDDYRAERLRLINGMKPGEEFQPGRIYKAIEG